MFLNQLTFNFDLFVYFCLCGILLLFRKTSGTLFLFASMMSWVYFFISSSISLFFVFLFPIKLLLFMVFSIMLHNIRSLLIILDKLLSSIHRHDFSKINFNIDFCVLFSERSHSTWRHWRAKKMQRKIFPIPKPHCMQINIKWAKFQNCKGKFAHFTISKNIKLKLYFHFENRD